MSQKHGEARWLLVLAGCVLVAAVWPLVRTPTFYFWNDTAAGAVGQWYYLGDRLLTGQWPLLDPSLWRGGNLIAEGQIGLFSPLTITIAVAMKLWVAAPLGIGGNLVVFVTVLKCALLLTGALGTYLLVRSYAAPPWTAFVAGLTVTVGGTTRYLDAASWVTGLEIWALLPLLWWALRRMTRTGGSPLLPLVLGYLLVSTGYVYGCLFVALAVLAGVVDARLGRRRRMALAILGVGVASAALAVTVYLPGVLTAPVTTRGGSDVVSDGRMIGDLLGMIIGVLPVPQAVSYVCWFLPLLAFLDLQRARALLRRLAGLLVVGVAVTLWILGPQQIGPLRYPARLMPAYVLVVVVAACVLLARARVARPSGRRLLLVLGWLTVTAWLATSRTWWFGGIAALSAVVAAGGIAVTWWLWRHRRPARVVSGFLAAWTLLVVGLQYAWFPVPPQLNRLLPADASAYRTQAGATRGDTIFVGNADRAMTTDPTLSTEFLVANTWMLNPASVQNTYSLAGYQSYVDRYCLIYNGMTCPKALDTLFDREPTTGLRRVDLLGISSVIIYRPDFPRLDTWSVPSGWRRAATGAHTTTWVRNRVRSGAGGVVWSSRGTRVETITRSANSVAFRVAPVGGTVVLSRLAYPGYRVSGAEVVGPTDGYLLTLRVPPTAVGQTVRVVFRPPGWTLELAALGLAAATLVGWPLAWSLRGRLSRRGPRSASPSGSPRTWSPPRTP